MNRSAAESVYSALFEDIRMRRLRPNELLQEEDLAARFKVSRTPVREAIRRLVQDGLLERRGASTSVRQLSIDEVANIYPMIAVMEGLAARLAASRIERQELETLAALHDRMSAERSESSSAFIESNQTFHDTIIGAARNPALAKEIERFRMITNHFRQVVLGMPQRQEQSVAEHTEILKALRAGDGERAETAMRNHVKTAEDVLMLLLRASQLVASDIAPEPSSEPRRQKTARNGTDQ